MNSTDALELHHITDGSPSSTHMLQAVLDLSNSIFDAQADSKYASFDEWTRRLSLPGAVLVYLAPRPAPARTPVTVRTELPESHRWRTRGPRSSRSSSACSRFRTRTGIRVARGPALGRGWAARVQALEGTTGVCEGGTDEVGMTRAGCS